MKKVVSVEVSAREYINITQLAKQANELFSTKIKKGKILFMCSITFLSSLGFERGIDF